MMFLWHHALWVLLVLPALAGMYLLLRRRRDAEDRDYPALRPLRETGASAGRMRHAPPLLMLTALALLLLSAARPIVFVTEPSEQGTVVLLMDVSLSMAASDVPPTRLAAARAAARAFVEAQPRDVRIAVVAFGGHADLVQPPTLDRAAVLDALDRLELQRFTAIGNGLIGALLTLEPTANIGEEYDIFGSSRTPVAPGAVPLDRRRSAEEKGRKPVPAGSYLSAAIILVSDGRGTMGVPPLKAAKMAADLGIRVYTVGVGTLYGGVANIDGWPAIHAEFEEDLLKEIASVTGGEYFLARTGDKLARIYETLGRSVIFERREIEITLALVALGVVFSVAAAALSLLWSARAL